MILLSTLSRLVCLYQLLRLMFHILKLFQNSPDAIVGKKPVVSEFYEEIVFQEPTAMMQQLLQNVRMLTTSPVKYDTDCKFEIFKCTSYSA